MAMSRFEGCKSLTTWPPIRISPEVIDSRPAMLLSKVDLPQPDGPTSTRKPPFSSEISMPFKISREPYFFLRERISRVDIDLSFHSAGHQAANKVTPSKNVDHEGGSSRDNRCGHIDVIFDNASGGVDDIVERHCHRGRVAGGEGRTEQEVVPDVGELVDDCHDEDRCRVRQDDAPEDLEKAGAVDLRRLDQLGGKRLVVVAEEKRREAEAVDDVHEHEVDCRIAEAERGAGGVCQRLPDAAELAEYRGHRNEHRLERN